MSETSLPPRQLEHLKDLTSGQPWTAMPEPLRSLWFHGEISDKKCKLIMIMLTHADNFHIKRNYLENRCKLHSTTLKRYLVELIEDGVVRVERFTLENGSIAKVYHTNRVAQWRLREDPQHAQPTPSPVRESYSDSATSTTSPVSDSPVSDSPLRELNKNKGNQKKKKPEQVVGWNEPTQPVERDAYDPHKDPSLIDACRRLEYCYKVKDTDFIDWKATRELLLEIKAEHGPEMLEGFVLWMEQRWEEMNRERPNSAFRPERMRSHWDQFASVEVRH